MVRRRLAITPELWTQMLTRTQPQTFRITRNALPEDAKCVGMEAVSRLWDERGVEGSAERGTIYLWVTSAVFQESDPIDLPSPVFVKELGNG